MSQDTEEILKNKNLPNLRGKLSSVKSHWQKTLHNAKIKTRLAGVTEGSYGSQTMTMSAKPMRDRSRLLLEQPSGAYYDSQVLVRKPSNKSPFVMRQAEAADNLRNVARDLEAYNRRKVGMGAQGRSQSLN